MDKFKSVRAWIGDDGAIHLNIVANTTSQKGQEAEFEIHDATLRLDPCCPVSRETETFFCGLGHEEYFYLLLDDNRLYLNKNADGIVYTVRTLPRKMTKAQIEEALGYSVEFIPDESEKEQQND